MTVQNLYNCIISDDKVVSYLSYDEISKFWSWLRFINNWKHKTVDYSFRQQITTKINFIEKNVTFLGISRNKRDPDPCQP